MLNNNNNTILNTSLISSYEKNNILCNKKNNINVEKKEIQIINENNEDLKSNDISDYYFINEYLRIKKNNNIFLSDKLKEYINDHIDIIQILNSSCLDFTDKHIDITVKLRYLRYQSKLKRVERKKNKKKKKKNLSEDNNIKKTILDETKETEEIQFCKLTKDNLIQHNINELDNLSTDLCNLNKSNDYALKILSDSSSLFSRSTSTSNNSNFSFSSLKKKKNKYKNLSLKSDSSSDESVLKQLDFDKKELSEIKKLEKSKNVYFHHINKIIEQYDKLTNMNISHFNNLIYLFFAFSTKNEIYVNEELSSITTFFEDEQNIETIRMCQDKLRTDIVNGLFYNLNDSFKLNDTNSNSLFSLNNQVNKLPSKISSNISKRIEATNDIYYEKFIKNYKDMKSKINLKNDQYVNIENNENLNIQYKTMDLNIKENIININKINIDNDTNQEINQKNKVASIRKMKLEENIKDNKNLKKIYQTKNLKEYLLNNLDNIKKHCNYKFKIFEEKKKILNKIVYLCSNQHKLIEEKKKIIIENEEKKRLKLLRENDMDAYMNLIKKTKNKKLQELLDVTDNFLNNLSNSIIEEKQNNQIKKNNEIKKDNQIKKNNQNKDYNENLNYNENENYKNARERYYTVTHTIKEKIKQPSILIGGKLMEYQLEGLEWLISLYNNNLNGILADEMGLGKTVETISLFSYIKEFKNINFKNLIIVPLSTLPNWLNEFNIWCPSLKVLTYRSSKNERREINRKLLEQYFDICITTFDYIIKEKSNLMKIKWGYIVVDEGHRMKNNKSKFHSVLMEYKSNHRLLLTGTPLQNNLKELWSLLNFLLPKIFSSTEDFEKWFSNPINNVANDDIYNNITEEEELLIINRLHSILLPFMLRRVKKDVLKCLPKKYEYNIYIELSLYQKILYKQIESNNFTEINEAGQITKKSFQNMLMQLRKAVNHPYLFLNDYNIDEMLIKSSGKFEVLNRMLPKLLKFKHKVLIFSQMTLLMDIMCDYLDYKRYKYHRLDGSIGLQERRKIIDEFNNIPKANVEIDFNNDNEENNENEGNKDTMIFILSTRSGSLGLNLQSADTVIIFDSDFNPHQDIQAMCRCHRMGQKNIVKVFRFITLSNVEEGIFQKAKDKLNINDKVIQAGLYNKTYNDEDRKNKLKNIIQRNKNTVTSIQPTNPILLNKYMERSVDELNYFMEYDRKYFGDFYFDNLNEMNMNQKVDHEQFKYMSEDENENDNENDNEDENEDDNEDGNENENKNKSENEIEIENEDENKDENENQNDNNQENEIKKNIQNKHLINENLQQKENNLNENNNVKHSDDNNGNNIHNIENNNENSKENFYEENNDSVNINNKQPEIHKDENNDDDYNIFLNENNQNEIEKILIKSNKLMNKEELPPYLFIKKTNEEISNFKRKRKMIYTNLLEDEKMSENQFLKLLDENYSESENSNKESINEDMNSSCEIYELENNNNSHKRKKCKIDETNKKTNIIEQNEKTKVEKEELKEEVKVKENEVKEEEKKEIKKEVKVKKEETEEIKEEIKEKKEKKYKENKIKKNDVEYNKNENYNKEDDEIINNNKNNEEKVKINKEYQKDNKKKRKCYNNIKNIDINIDKVNNNQNIINSSKNIKIKKVKIMT